MVHLPDLEDTVAAAARAAHLEEEVAWPALVAAVAIAAVGAAVVMDPMFSCLASLQLQSHSVAETIDFDFGCGWSAWRVLLLTLMLHSMLPCERMEIARDSLVLLQ
jgi:hypothetical protein